MPPPRREPPPKGDRLRPYVRPEIRSEKITSVGGPLPSPPPPPYPWIPPKKGG